MGQHAFATWTFAAALVLLPLTALAQSKLGYVDMKRLLDNAPQVQAGRERLQREFAARDTSLKQDEARLAELRRSFDSESAQLDKPTADTRTPESLVKRSRRYSV